VSAISTHNSTSAGGVAVAVGAGLEQHQIAQRLVVLGDAQPIPNEYARLASGSEGQHFAELRNDVCMSAADRARVEEFSGYPFDPVVLVEDASFGHATKIIYRQLVAPRL
jgi:hypothetical protein